VLSNTVGSAAILQHTPRVVTSAPPSLVTSPPQEAVVPVMDVTSAVDTTASVAGSSFLHPIKRSKKTKNSEEILVRFFMCLRLNVYKLF